MFGKNPSLLETIDEDILEIGSNEEEIRAGTFPMLKREVQKKISHFQAKGFFLFFVLVGRRLIFFVYIKILKLIQIVKTLQLLRKFCSFSRFSSASFNI